MDGKNKMIKETYSQFLDRFFKALEEKGVDVLSLNLDHLAFRTQDLKLFEDLKKEASSLGERVHENYLSGNQVLIFKLSQPWQYKERKIGALELIGPNEKINYPTGFEHAEFTIKEDFKEFAGKYPNLNWDMSSCERKDFPMIKLPLAEFMQVKFNHVPVLEMARRLGEEK